MVEILHRRADNSFVIRLENGWPYHVQLNDPMYEEVLSESTGLDLEDEPQPQQINVPAAFPTPREFMDRLSMARQTEITLAATTNATVLLWLLRLLGAAYVDVSLAETIQGVEALRQAGVITQAEATLLLT